MAAETLTFRLDDNQYEVPDIADLDMDEWQVMYDHAGLTLDDFAPVLDEQGEIDEDADAERIQRLRSPGFTRALLHIGLQRQHPNMKPAEVKAITGKARLTRVLEALGEAASEGDDDQDPPAPTSAPEPSSPPSSGGSTESGSVVSLPSSDEPADDPEATTTSGSGTSSTSDQTTSAA